MIAASKPNIVLILTDDQGFDDYGFCQPPLETPVMDKIMKDGVQFTRFYTAAACAPTRSALMTGRNFMRTGTSAVGFGAEAPHLDEYLLSEAMQDAGYVTGMMGKWNLGLSDADLPSQRGFDEAWPVVRDDVRSYGRYEHFNPPFFHNGSYAGREDGWQVERVTDKAIDFIQANQANPFFLYIPYAAPHEPWLCPRDLQEKYINKGIGEQYAMFLGMMEQLDTQVGRVLQSLEDLGLADDTIVLFFGDNGPTPTTRILQQDAEGFFSLTTEYYTLNEEEWAARNPSGFRSKKATGWENALRNRLSIYSPAMYEPKIIEKMTLVMDIYPTLVELAGGNRSLDKLPLDGQSLMPLLSGQTAWPERGYFTGETGKPEQYLASDGWNYRFTEHALPLYRRETWFAGTQGGDVAELEAIRNDPHAWSDPVQEVRPEAYLEMECVYRFKGKNSVTWANTFFHEIGAVQEMKVRVLESGTYQATMRILGVSEETTLRFSVGEVSKKVKLASGKKYHNFGTIDLKAGEQVLAVELLEIGNEKAISKMELFSMELEKE